MSGSAEDISWRKKGEALARVARYRPRFTGGLIVLGGIVALLKGIDLSFIYPIMEVAQSGDVEPQDPILDAFLTTYDFLGVPFSLGFLIIGIGAVMTVRFTSSFLAAWMRALL